MVKVISLSVVLFCALNAFAQPWAAQMAPQSDSTNSILEFRTRNELMIVPVIINKRIRVNVALDPHCKTMILFGNRYKKLLHVAKAKRSVDEEASQYISFHNSVRLGPATEEDATIIVISNKDAVNFFTGVNGVIGTEILEKYNVTVDRKKLLMTIKPAEETSASASGTSADTRH